jgi:uroporphyrinogen-III synthase
MIAPDLNLLHLSGAAQRSPTQPLQRITSVAVYRAQPTPAPDLSSAPGSVALIHSPRGGGRLAELVHERDSILIAAISQAGAEAVGNGWARVEAAEQPNDDALLALAARLCNNPQPK